MDYSKSWTTPGQNFLNEGQPVANVNVTGLSTSDAKKLAKWLPDLLTTEKKNKKFSSASRGVEKRVSIKGNTVFISDPGSGMDTFHIESMIRRQLKAWNMRGKVDSSTHRQR